MIAKQTLFLNGDRSAVVAEGDPAARFLLVKAGHEIPDSVLEKHKGAADMAAKETKSKAPEPVQQKGPAPQNRESAMKLKQRQK